MHVLVASSTRVCTTRKRLPGALSFNLLLRRRASIKDDWWLNTFVVGLLSLLAERCEHPHGLLVLQQLGDWVCALRRDARDTTKVAAVPPFAVGAGNRCTGWIGGLATVVKEHTLPVDSVVLCRVNHQRKLSKVAVKRDEFPHGLAVGKEVLFRSRTFFPGEAAAGVARLAPREEFGVRPVTVVGEAEAAPSGTISVVLDGVKVSGDVRELKHGLTLLDKLEQLAVAFVFVDAAEARNSAAEDVGVAPVVSLWVISVSFLLEHEALRGIVGLGLDEEQAVVEVESANAVGEGGAVDLFFVAGTAGGARRACNAITPKLDVDHARAGERADSVNALGPRVAVVGVVSALIDVTAERVLGVRILEGRLGATLRAAMVLVSANAVGAVEVGLSLRLLRLHLHARADNPVTNSAGGARVAAAWVDREDSVVDVINVRGAPEVLLARAHVGSSRVLACCRVGVAGVAAAFGISIAVKAFVAIHAAVEAAPAAHADAEELVSAHIFTLAVVVVAWVVWLADTVAGGIAVVEINAADSVGANELLLANVVAVLVFRVQIKPKEGQALDEGRLNTSNLVIRVLLLEFAGDDGTIGIFALVLHEHIH